jgi:hypothetical protein
MSSHFSKLVFLALIFSMNSLALAEDVCAERSSDLTQFAQIHTALQGYNSTGGLFGRWKLGGLAALVAKLNVELKEENGGFYVKVNSDPSNQVFICVGDDASGALKIKVLKPAMPENGLFLVKPNDSKNAISIVAQKSGWKFLKLNRIQ